jgi:hypothetical protein
VANWGMIKQYFYIRSKKINGELSQYPPQKNALGNRVYLWKSNPQIQPYGFEFQKLR